MTALLPTALPNQPQREVAASIKQQVLKRLSRFHLADNYEVWVWPFYSASSLYGCPTERYHVVVTFKDGCRVNDARIAYDALAGFKLTHRNVMTVTDAPLAYQSDFEDDKGLTSIYEARFFV